MPRRGRLHIPGGCYHVIGRGLERRYIFDAVEDKKNFLARLESLTFRCDVRCLAWALMSNHYHFLLQVGQKPLSKFMAPLLGGYGGYYNRKYGRCGYVFQNRYQSILCDADSYLRELVCYIHLNPVKAGMIEDSHQLERYRWTGHAAAFGRYSQPWHDVQAMLTHFGNSKETARDNYRQFVLQGSLKSSTKNLSGGGLIRSSGGWEALSRFRQEHITCIGDERILGDSTFIEQALKQDSLDIERRDSLELKGWNLDKLIEKVCTFCDAKEQYLLYKNRGGNSSTAKSLICFWATEKLNIPRVEIASRLKLSQSAVSYRTSKGREYCEANEVDFDDFLRKINW
ncbi:MAG: putative transposase [Pseudohongiellaceae bacterium]|jgi:putative transposase